MLEGTESLETLDFNLYMSPQDHFSFAITADGDGALLRTEIILVPSRRLPRRSVH